MGHTTGKDPSKYPEGYAVTLRDQMLCYMASGVDIKTLFDEAKQAYEQYKSYSKHETGE